MISFEKLLRGILFFIFIFTISLYFTNLVSAQVVINEFLAHPLGGENEWVELYNSGDENISLASWILTDSANHNQNLNSLGEIVSHSFLVFEYSGGDGWLNNSGGDTVILKDGESLIDSYSYSFDLAEGISVGRYPDGTGSFYILSSATKGSTNSSPLVSPTPNPTSVPEPTQTISPTSTPVNRSATYKINETKDSQGNVLANVKIYVDDVYVHHYAPEALTFCDGCTCEGYVSCAFGDHRIKLAKDNYQDWQETRNIQVGNSFEVNPVLAQSVQETFTPSPKPTTKPSPTLTISPSKSATPTGEVLGEESESSSAGGLFYPMSSENASESSSPGSSKTPFWPFILLASGLLLLFSGGFGIWYNFIGPGSIRKSRFRERDGNKQQEIESEDNQNID